MTTTNDDMSNDLDQVTPAPIEIQDDDYVAEEDPIIAEMRAAEAEIAAGGQNTAEADPTDGAETDEEPSQKQEKPTDYMIPKGRLDQALSERDLLRDQVNYLQGALAARTAVQSKAVDEGGSNAPAPQQETRNDNAPDQGQAAQTVDQIDAAIEAMEAKKLELAARYDEGEISTVEWRKAEIDIDKEVRGLSKQRLDQVREESRAETMNVLSADRQMSFVNNQALEIQKQHPNVAVIDAIQSESVRDGIWQDIANQAAQNLAARGVNVSDGSLETRLAYIKEKAALTDRYTPETLQAFLPAGFKASSHQQGTGQPAQSGQKQLSPEALNRASKLDLAATQPPSISDMGNGLSQGELTEADILKMTEDEVADLLSKAPNLVQRALGASAI